MMSRNTSNRLGLLCVLGFSAVLTACASSPLGSSAPVDDRGTMAGRPAVAGAAAPGAAVANGAPATPKNLPGAENAGKPGYYTVRPGDTMIRIGLEAGQSWREIARWNGLDNANIIEVGQVLRIIPPGTAAVAAAPLPAVAGAGTGTPATASPPAAGASDVVTRPVTSPSPVTAGSVPPPGTRSVAAASPAASAPTPASVTPQPAPAPVAAAPLPPASSPSDEDVGWIWPTAGSVITRFDEASNKGIGINGKLGDPVLAAGDGRVVYSGAGLRGYGNLVILKHNNTYLTAYAHNQTLLVKEDQTVRKGQKIAEMGQSDADRVKLHFEIRRQGKPVDPLRFLPAR
jgi:lipoprotein NlpD